MLENYLSRILFHLIGNELKKIDKQLSMFFINKKAMNLLKVILKLLRNIQCSGVSKPSLFCKS